MVKENTVIDYACSGRLHVDTDEINSVDKCAAGVKANPFCSNKFFYDSWHNWCMCEKNGGMCRRNANSDYNEYRLTVGASNFIL